MKQKTNFKILTIFLTAFLLGGFMSQEAFAIETLDISSLGTMIE